MMMIIDLVIPRPRQLDFRVYHSVAFSPPGAGLSPLFSETGSTSIPIALFLISPPNDPTAALRVGLARPRR